MPGDDGAEVARVLLDVVRATCRDLHRQPARRVDVRLDSSLDRDLGLDSLARVELLLRVERAFRVRLAENTLAIVETPQESKRRWEPCREYARVASPRSAARIP